MFDALKRAYTSGVFVTISYNGVGDFLVVRGERLNRSVHQSITRAAVEEEGCPLLVCSIDGVARAVLRDMPSGEFVEDGDGRTT